MTADVSERTPGALPGICRRNRRNFPNVVTGTVMGLVVATTSVFAGCRRAPSGESWAGSPLATAELGLQHVRYWEDQLRLTESRGPGGAPTGIGVPAMRDSLHRARQDFRDRLHAPRPPLRTASDSAALAIMQLADTSRDTENVSATDSAGSTGHVVSRDALASITDTVMAAYGRAANTIVFDGDTLNRLAILGMLSRTDDAGRRQRLFMALRPVWQSVNGNDSPTSPYRALVRLRRAAWGDSASPIERKGRAFGLTAAQVETWLTDALDAWRSTMPDTLLEPWDWYYYTGAANRQLSARAPGIADIRRVNDAYYTALGASPESLHIAYDLEARTGKYPVAFTDFGIRNRWIDGHMVSGAPWVFTSYLAGGFDNLAELLHETGHGIHIAGIHTRPAFVDWPDNDTFTEALADVPALEMYEPVWQHRFLGDSVSLPVSLRAKYAAIVFDMAWALLEIRVHRDANADPNVLWTEITSHYLRIRPHPEWSWWAMRGQLIDAPGYLINYALGAFLVADMRAQASLSWGAFATADASTYAGLSEQLYRFGRERTSRQVLEDFLGRSPSPNALLADLRRMSH